MTIVKTPPSQLFTASNVTWEEFDCRKGQAKAGAQYLQSLANKHYSISSAVWKKNLTGTHAFNAALSVLEMAEADIETRDEKHKTKGGRSLPTVKTAFAVYATKPADAANKDLKIVNVAKPVKPVAARDPKDVVWDAVKSGNFELAKYVVATT